MTPYGIEPATFLFVAQHLNHCATTVPQNQKCIRQKSRQQKNQKVKKVHQPKCAALGPITFHSHIQVMSQINSGKGTSRLGCDTFLVQVKQSEEIGFLGLLDPNDEGTEILPHIKNCLLSDAVSHPRRFYLQQHCYKNLKSHNISAISCQYKIILCAVYSLKSYHYQ